MSLRNVATLSTAGGINASVEGDLTFKRAHIVWKLLKMSHFNFWIWAFSTNFCPIKTDLSGNTVWPQASGFQKIAQMDHFWHFLINFCPFKM